MNVCSCVTLRHPTFTIHIVYMSHSTHACTHSHACAHTHTLTHTFLISSVAHGQDELQSQHSLQVIHGHQGAQDGAGPQGVTAPSLDRLRVRRALAQQVHQGGVEVQDGRPHVDVVFIIFRRQGVEVVLAEDTRVREVSTGEFWSVKKEHVRFHLLGQF